MFVTLMLAAIHMAIHELGHILAVLAVGARVKKIGIDRRGVYVIRSQARTPQRNALVSLAGPGANLITWVVMLGLHIPHAWIALYTAIFNLIPWKHSDMSHALMHLRQE